MSYEDPFAAAPADEPEIVEAEPAGAVTVDVKPNILPAYEGKVVVTLKGGSGFDAPWIVIHAASVEDAHSQFDQKLADLMSKVHKAASHFSGSAPVNPNSSAKPAQQGQPAGSKQPPANAPEAPGPGWEYKTGFAKASGKPWQGWFPPRGSDEKPVFFN